MLRVRSGLWLLLAVASGVSACKSDEGPKPIVPVEGRQNYLVSLQPIEGGCGAVMDSIRQAKIAEMNQTIDAAINAYIKAAQEVKPCNRNSHYEDNGRPAAAASPPDTNGKDGASSVSGTNNQVASVDEADFVKNTNKYIYLVKGNSLKIFEAWPADATKLIGSIAVEGEAKKLLVEGQRAVVFSSLNLPAQNQSSASTYRGYTPRGGECTYGYSCVPTGDGYPTKITVIDIADPEAPKIISEFRFPLSSLLAARRIGTAIHVVTHTANTGTANIRYRPDAVDASPYCRNVPVEEQQAVVNAFEKLRADNTKILQEEVLQLPSVVHGDQELLAQCSGYFKTDMANAQTLTMVFSFDLLDLEKHAATTVLSQPGVVYASEQSLYMAVPYSKSPYYGWFVGQSMAEATIVHKFRIGEDASIGGYLGSGMVKGRVLNQFALDEHNGYLRIATTTGHLGSNEVHSTVFVLAQRSESLELAGPESFVDGLGPKEDIRSVRFAGDYGYVVTFKKTDPLYVLSLKDPEHPKLEAALKIPGFSTYMHRMDDKHLLTIGYDADDQGDFAWFRGVMLQIFDVSDPQNPTLIPNGKVVIGARGSSSEALTNHLAFTYMPDRHLLSFPLTICEGGTGGAYGNTMTFSGLMVFDTAVDGALKLQERGRVAHPTSADARGYNHNGCNNWWTDASTDVKRSIIMDDFVFSISEKRIKVSNLNALATDGLTIPLDP